VNGGRHDDWNICPSLPIPRPACASLVERPELAAKQSVDLLALLEQSTRLTWLTQELTQSIKELTDEIDRRVASD
jgi:hypothetical protein